MSALAYSLYNLFQIPAGLLGLPLALTRGGGGRAGHLTRRLGLSPPRLEPGGLWIHALSLGEVISARPLLEELRRRRPGVRLWLSAATAAGLAQAEEERAAGRADQIFLSPLDLAPLLGPWLDWLRPEALIIVETDLWPNLIRACRRRRIPVLVVNFRISPSRHRSHRLLRPFFRTVYGQLTAVGLPTELDQTRFDVLGLGPPLIRVVTGSLKYDQPPPRAARPDEVGLLPGQMAVVAGSTHAGEEEMVLEAFGRLRVDFPDLALILAPRDRPRFEAVAGLIARQGLGPARLSRGESLGPGRPVLLVDVLGRLASLYGLARAAFVGGSLVPAGGHNPLEPAALAAPVFFGPHMEDFLAEAKRLLAGGGRLVRDAGSLAVALGQVLAQPELARAMGRAARQVFLDHQGAAGRTGALISRALGWEPGP